MGTERLVASKEAPDDTLLEMWKAKRFILHILSLLWGQEASMTWDDIQATIIFILFVVVVVLLVS